MKRIASACCVLLLLGLAGCERGDDQPSLPTEVSVTQTASRSSQISSTTAEESTTETALQDDKTSQVSEPDLVNPPGYHAQTEIAIRLNFAAEEGVSRRTTETPTYTLVNQSDSAIVTGQAVDLYELVDGEWLLYTKEVPWNTLQHTIEPGESESFDLPLSLFQVPRAGVYSLAKAYDTEQEDGYWVISQGFYIRE